MLVHGRLQYRGPGDFDPVVNTNLQIQLQEEIHSAWFEKTKEKIGEVVKGLKITYQDMNINGGKPWWDSLPLGNTCLLMWGICATRIWTVQGS